MPPNQKINYDQLLLEGESQTLEFKPSFDQTTVESLVAFANAQGGRALLTFTQSNGVNEGVNMLLAVIHKQTGLRAPALAQTLQTLPIKRVVTTQKANGSQPTLIIPDNRLGRNTIVGAQLVARWLLRSPDKSGSHEARTA
jgi:predicted HTH transcriptional regulator